MAEVIMNGVNASSSMCRDLTNRCEALREKGVVPCLAILRVGSKPEDISYERSAEKRCTSVGIEVKNIVFPDNACEQELISKICQLNADDTVHGVLILLPLPPSINERSVCEALSPEKDVDGISSGSMASVYLGSGPGYTPCTAQAVMELLKYYNIPIAGKHAVVVGRSLVVGRPVSMLLMGENASVTICHSKTENLADICRSAQIVVAAAGHINSITADCLSPGQTVVDVGINFDDKTQKTLGDVDFEAAEPIVYAISPVPRGVGSVTTSVLAAHVTEAAERSLIQGGF